MTKMNRLQYARMLRAREDVTAERLRQYELRGEQTLGRGIDPEAAAHLECALHLLRRQQDEGRPTWDAVLLEEACELLLEADPAKARVEAIQLSAVAMQGAEAMERARLAAQAGAGATRTPEMGAGKGVAEIGALEGAGCAADSVPARLDDCGLSMPRAVVEGRAYGVAYRALVVDEVDGCDANGSEVPDAGA